MTTNIFPEHVCPICGAEEQAIDTSYDLDWSSYEFICPVEHTGLLDPLEERALYEAGEWVMSDDGHVAASSLGVLRLAGRLGEEYHVISKDMSFISISKGGSCPMYGLSPTKGDFVRKGMLGWWDFCHPADATHLITGFNGFEPVIKKIR